MNTYTYSRERESAQTVRLFIEAGGLYFFPSSPGALLILRGTAYPGAGGPGFLVAGSEPRAFRNSRVNADLSSLLSQSSGRCSEQHLREIEAKNVYAYASTYMYTYRMCNGAHVCLQRSCLVKEKERSGEEERHREKERGSLRAFVFIMAPIYPLMTTRERSADMAARRSYDIFLAYR